MPTRRAPRGCEACVYATARSLGLFVGRWALVNSSAKRTSAPVWVSRRERSNLWVLRLMSRIALGAGRRAARALLVPITLYFLCTGGAARRASAQYLARVLGRPPRWTERYRHMHSFAATILDRIYFLTGRFEEFSWRATGEEAFEAALAHGEGVLLIGAHLGSFEALRALGEQRGLRVAMVMYEDNARLLNATLASVAPQASLHTIALGRLDAMLSLRHWLAGGGIAGLLADRTLATPSPRSRSLALPFLGTPAHFADGPFRLAALLRQRIVFMAGLYHGGRNYELRFTELADFSALAATAVPTAADTDAQIAAALRRYVAVVEQLCREAPYNWFNFYDYWATDAHEAAAG